MFEWKTSAIKFLSCACCVGAGLPVGPEGPMIFLGATLGGLVSQGTVNFSLMPPSKFRDSAESALSSAGSVLWPFKRFRNKVDQRDFMTAGCAAGVAGAFGAPIGARPSCAAPAAA
jgi:chloride channel 7